MLTSCTCTMETHRQRVSLVDSAVVLDLGQAWALRTNFTLDLHQTAPLSTTGSKQHIEVCFFFELRSCSRMKGFSAPWLAHRDVFFHRGWALLYKVDYYMVDSQGLQTPCILRDSLAFTRLSVWLNFMYEVCIFSARVTRRQAIVMQVRLQAGREIKNNCCVRVLAWFSYSQGCRSNPTQRISFSGKTPWNILHYAYVTYVLVLLNVFR